MGPKKTIAKRVSRGTSSTNEPFDSTWYRTLENFKKYDSLVKFMSIWSERKVFIDELDPFIQQNLDSRGWLPLCTGFESPPFYSFCCIRWSFLDYLDSR